MHQTETIPRGAYVAIPTNGRSVVYVRMSDLHLDEVTYEWKYPRKRKKPIQPPEFDEPPAPSVE